MTVTEFNKKFILSFKVDDIQPDNIIFTLKFIDRLSLQESTFYKLLKSETPVEWLTGKIEEEVLAGRNPAEFQQGFYENVKRKLINTFFIKNRIQGLNTLDTSKDIGFLFK